MIHVFRIPTYDREISNRGMTNIPMHASKAMEPDNTASSPGRSDPQTWVDRFGDSLYAFALARVKDPDTAEDLVQETFLAALGAREGFEGRSSMRTWLIAILKHKIIDHMRHASRERPLNGMTPEDPAEEAFFDAKGKWRLKPAKWQTDPVKLLEQKQFWEVFRRCLSETPGRLADAFRLREMDGHTCKEIAEVLNITLSNCWVMLYRARMWMRRCLEVNGFGAKAFRD
jgi:RNA polymerase sigma-70 factor (ECF subfamily)